VTPSLRVGSQLAHGRGALVTRVLAESDLDRLRKEAVASHAGAEEIHVAEPDEETWRGGSPDRWLESAVGGAMLQALYHSREITARLHELTGVRWTQSGGAGTYSYYRRPGHHLGIHRDVDECDLALITCVHSSRGAQSGWAGALCLYPDRTGETIPELRTRPDVGAHYVHLQPGESVVLLGGVVPHRLLPVEEGHQRIVAPLCFRPG
jgi:hypothetical protein